MPLTRRQLLQISTLSSVSVGLLGGGIAWSWWDVPANRPFRHLTTLEGEMVQAIALAAFPSGATIEFSGKDARLDHFFDQLLDNMTVQNQKLLKLLLEALQRLPILTTGSSFLSCTPETQQKLVLSWLSSDNYLFRSGFQSLVVLMSMGYTSHPKIAPILATNFRCGFGQ